MAVYEQGHGPIDGAGRASVFMQYAGAVVSLALVAGIGIWGYKLVMRDVTGIPVVRAMEGDMRVLPDTPGGSVTSHVGLSVNAVAAKGEAEGFGDSVLLAPTTTGLAAEDIEVAQETPQQLEAAIDSVPVVNPIQVSLATPSADAPALTTVDILALADQIAADSAPLTALADVDDVVAQAVSLAFPNAKLRTSIRPEKRAIATHQSVSAKADATVSTETFSVGTHLVQLGAYPTAEVAATEWERLQGRFDQLLSTKTRVIQLATTGGKEFYRLRAHGFDAGADARRLCAAMVAERADCIPVVVR